MDINLQSPEYHEPPTDGDVRLGRIFLAVAVVGMAVGIAWALVRECWTGVGR